MKLAKAAGHSFLAAPYTWCIYMYKYVVYISVDKML